MQLAAAIGSAVESLVQSWPSAIFVQSAHGLTRTPQSVRTGTEYMGECKLLEDNEWLPAALLKDCEALD
jgi:hypothetical protein